MDLLWHHILVVFGCVGSLVVVSPWKFYRELFSISIKNLKIIWSTRHQSIPPLNYYWSLWQRDSTFHACWMTREVRSTSCTLNFLMLFSPHGVHKHITSATSRALTALVPSLRITNDFFPCLRIRRLWKFKFGDWQQVCIQLHNWTIFSMCFVCNIINNSFINKIPHH